MKLKILFITILTLSYTTRIGSKKRNFEEIMTSQNPDENHNYNYSYSIICDDLCSYTIVPSDQSQIKYKKHDVSNIGELLNLLDFIEVSEPSTEELNKFSPVTLDYDSLNELLEDEKDSYLINDEVQFINYKEEFKAINDSNNGSNIHKSSSMYNNDNVKLESNVLIEEKSKWDDFYIYIKNYNSKYMPETYRNKYDKIIEFIAEACVVLDNNKLDWDKYFLIFNTLQDKKIVDKLREMVFKFDKSSKFDQKTFSNFLKEFNSEIYNSSCSLKIRAIIFNMDKNQKILIFNYEFFKLYKYVDDIPELLTLGNLYSTLICHKTILIIHLINKLSVNFKENKVFILCMIAKALLSFHQNNFEIFKIPYFEFECDEHKLNLYYLVWEFSRQKRQDIVRRKKKRTKCTYSDKRDFKIVFLTYIYQIRIFEKYYKIDALGITLLKEFIDKIINNEDCLVCLFSEYLSILFKFKIKSFKS